MVCISDTGIRNDGRNGDLQVIENMQESERSANCYREGASDEPAAGKTSGEPREQQIPRQEQPPTSGPKRERPAREVCSRYGGNNHRPHKSWEASDQRRTAKRHSDGSGVLCIWQRIDNWVRESGRGTPKVHLPAGSVRCSIGVAYQAADASHPSGAERARREQGSFAATFIPLIRHQRRKLP